MSPTVVTDLREIKDYTLISGDLYRRLHGGVLALCINMQEAKKKCWRSMKKLVEMGELLVFTADFSG
jgi:hypothetical protein